MRLPPLVALDERLLDMGNAQAVYDEPDCVVRSASPLTFRRDEPAPARRQIFLE